MINSYLLLVSSKKSQIAIFILLNICGLIFFILPHNIFSNMLDLRFSYSVSDVIGNLEEIGVDGRRIYIYTSLILDTIYPILYTDLDSYWLVEKRWPKYDNGRPIPGIAVHTGNKRVWWAKQNGYDKIEGIYVNSKAEQAKLVKITHIPHGNLPHYPNSYGRGRR